MCGSPSGCAKASPRPKSSAGTGGYCVISSAIASPLRHSRPLRLNLHAVPHLTIQNTQKLSENERYLANFRTFGPFQARRFAPIRPPPAVTFKISGEDQEIRTPITPHSPTFRLHIHP